MGEGPRASRFEVADRPFAVVSVPMTVDPDALPELTAAERAICQLVLEGRSNAEIAAARARSARTVANQLRSIFTKIGVASKAELVANLAERLVGRR